MVGKCNTSSSFCLCVMECYILDIAGVYVSTMCLFQCIMRSSLKFYLVSYPLEFSNSFRVKYFVEVAGLNMFEMCSSLVWNVVFLFSKIFGRRICRIRDLPKKDETSMGQSCQCPLVKSLHKDDTPGVLPPFVELKQFVWYSRNLRTKVLLNSFLLQYNNQAMSH